MIGRTIGHYRILEKLGEGGMGEVFLAQDTSLDRKVAIKVLAETSRQDRTAKKRLLREARLAAALDHPYICGIHELLEVGDTSCIVMEYVEGADAQGEAGRRRPAAAGRAAGRAGNHRSAGEGSPEGHHPP